MRILIVDDEQEIREKIAQILQFEQMDVATAQNGVSAKRLLEEDVFAAVVTDLSMPGMNGMELLQWIQAEGPLIPVIMMSAYGDISDAVEAMKSGAQDYIVKPFQSEELIIRLQRIFENYQLQKQVEQGQQSQTEPDKWIGECLRMLTIKELIHKIAPTTSSVLITGESGTGKDVIAKRIHALSPRAKQPFVAINIGGVPESLLESELFGHEKGAFTGATSRKIGMFELASSGTLFLDEIGDMPLQLQVKLLRVLQERKIQRLGSTQTLPIDVRILSATNRNLEERLQSGLFREDLYYRLKVFHIELPPLRERREDIAIFTGHFIKKYAALTGKTLHSIEPDALHTLQNYHFPGNIRELENIIERAVILAHGKSITRKELDVAPLASKAFVRPGTLDDLQKYAIREALLRWEGNRTKAAQELGISRQTLLNKIKEYGILVSNQ